MKYTDPDGSNIATAFLKGFGLSLYSDIQSFSEFIAYTSIGSFFGDELGEMVGIAVYGIKTDIELYNTIVYNWPEISGFEMIK